MAEHVLCDLEDIPDGGARGFAVERTLLLVVRRDGNLYAYVNSCPHIGTPLDFSPDRFLSYDAKYILCSTHGALFRIEDGHCISGPCAGDSLDPINVAVHNGQVKISL